MKSLIIFTLSIFLFNSVSFADIPPPSGMEINTEITGSAASILAESIGGEDQNFPSALGELKTIDGRPITSGVVRTTKKTIIGCSTYYYRGHQAICKLYKKY